MRGAVHRDCCSRVLRKRRRDPLAPAISRSPATACRTRREGPRILSGPRSRMRLMGIAPMCCASVAAIGSFRISHDPHAPPNPRCVGSGPAAFDASLPIRLPILNGFSCRGFRMTAPLRADPRATGAIVRKLQPTLTELPRADAWMLAPVAREQGEPCPVLSSRSEGRSLRVSAPGIGLGATAMSSAARAVGAAGLLRAVQTPHP